MILKRGKAVYLKSSRADCAEIALKNNNESAVPCWP